LRENTNAISKPYRLSRSQAFALEQLSLHDGATINATAARAIKLGFRKLN
jgi:hypothetical protein